MKRIGIAALLLWASSVYSEYDRHIESLKGLEEIAVFIEFLVEKKQSGLTERQLQSDVELILRKAGVKILSKAEIAQTPGAPVLKVHIWSLYLRDIEQYGSNSFVFAFSVELAQTVLLQRDPRMMRVLTPTWSKKSVGIVGKNRAAKYICDNIADYVKRFLNDYLTANPIERTK